MTRADLFGKHRALSRAYNYAFWIFAFAIVGGILAVPSLRDLSPWLGALTGDSWLVPLIVGIFAISVWRHIRTPRCPDCRRTLNVAFAIATDRCERCGQIAVDDPRYTVKRSEDSQPPRAQLSVGKSTTLELLVLSLGGKLTLLIPLEAGGNELSECSRGISEIDGSNLKVTIPDWLADKLGVHEGSRVRVDNDGGKFNITAIEALPTYTRQN
jgi:hypothetical protein